MRRLKVSTDVICMPSMLMETHLDIVFDDETDFLDDLMLVDEGNVTIDILEYKVNIIQKFLFNPTATTP